MQSFTWGKNYETGIKDIDDQHQNLVDIINQLGQFIVNDNISYNDLNGLICKLASYVAHHFSYEEQMMIDIKIDPRHLTAHIATHKKFLSEIEYLAKDLSSDSTTSAKQLFEFLIHWLSYHILGSDHDMARQIECIEKGLTPQQAFDNEEREKNQTTKPLLEALTGLFELVSMRNKELIELNLSLEDKVAKRTEQLHQANLHLEEISLTDVLTKLPNRRHAMRHLISLWNEAIENNSAFSCIMIDADYFKEINDTYGHDAGDNVLINLAQTLQGAVRTDDAVCRLGGDEFLVLCPCTDNAGAQKVAEAIHQAVQSLTVITGNGQWQGSISIGVATKDIHTTSYETLLKSADNGLYAAKRDGRNCIRFGNDE